MTPPNDTPGFPKQVSLAPHDIPRILRVGKYYLNILDEPLSLSIKNTNFERHFPILNVPFGGFLFFFIVCCLAKIGHKTQTHNPSEFAMNIALHEETKIVGNKQTILLSPCCRLDVETPPFKRKTFITKRFHPVSPRVVWMV